MAKIERLIAGGAELREDGRKLYILAVSEGRAADSLREVFVPGSLQWSDTGIKVRTAHNLDAGSATGFPTRVSNEIRVQLRPTPELREAVQDGKKYASIEFHALAERLTESGIREINTALLVGVTLTDRPAYRTTSAEMRENEIFMPELWV